MRLHRENYLFIYQRRRLPVRRLLLGILSWRRSVLQWRSAVHRVNWHLAWMTGHHHFYAILECRENK